MLENSIEIVSNLFSIINTNYRGGEVLLREI